MADNNSSQIAFVGPKATARSLSLGDSFLSMKAFANTKVSPVVERILTAPDFRQHGAVRRHELDVQWHLTDRVR